MNPLLLQIDTPENIQVATTEVSLWELVAGENGQSLFIMIPLMIMSVIAVYIFVERFLAVNRASKEEKDFMSKIKDYLKDGKIDSAKDLCARSENPAARMIEKGISRLGKSQKDIAASIENTGKLEVMRLEQRLNFLATSAGAAPMIGFLGTTIGMVNVFIEMKSMQSLELSTISPGIMQAMITTVGGLIVGIISYVGYNYLVGRIEKVVYKMENTAIDFMDLLNEPGK
ncbi:MotA/TolQ/ExbB proton channel family protein [Wandonia haliotis]|uniref:MotA/TolQ/ExbB proton channel family protein n=1 Tax=Wandonia haliotis TaxID=574963 RepID=A0ABN1MT51_9FLAO